MKYIPFYIAVFLCLFVSCSQNLSTEIITVSLPEYPPKTENTQAYPELSRWYIQVQSQNFSQHFYTKQNQFSLEVNKNQPLSITATPITFIQNDEIPNQENLFFHPAGAIYPMNWENQIINLTWNQGFSASLMETLFLSTTETGVTTEHMNQFLSSFNWKKLQDSIDEKVSQSYDSQTFYNPWQIDRERLLENLSCAIFSADYLKTKNLLTIQINQLKLTESSSRSLISSFIPENQFIQDQGILTVQKNQTSTYLINQKYAARITASSAKKVLLDLLYLPIFNDEYEY